MYSYCLLGTSVVKGCTCNARKLKLRSRVVRQPNIQQKRAGCISNGSGKTFVKRMELTRRVARE